MPTIVEPWNYEALEQALKNRREVAAKDREEARPAMSKPIPDRFLNGPTVGASRPGSGRIIGHNSVTGPIWGHDGFVISNKQEPLGHHDSERAFLERWGYHVQMIPPKTPLDDPKGTPNVTLRYADSRLRGEVEQGLFSVGRTINLTDVLHLMGKKLSEYCSEPSATRWPQMEAILGDVQTHYKIYGAKYASEIAAIGLISSDTSLAGRIAMELEGVVSKETQAHWGDRFKDVALEIDSVLQSSRKEPKLLS